MDKAMYTQNIDDKTGATISIIGCKSSDDRPLIPGAFPFGEFRMHLMTRSDGKVCAVSPSSACGNNGCIFSWNGSIP
jgi:hypothetical protein